jgi:hypothetical protein
MKRENSYTSPFRCKNISSIKSYSAIIRKNIYFFLVIGFCKYSRMHIDLTIRLSHKAYLRLHMLVF